MRLFPDRCDLLIFEVIWTRLLLLSLGTTPVAMGVVLAAFIGGMAMGAWTAGRRFVRRFSPVVLYAGLEAWIGYLLQIPMGVEGHDVSSRLYDLSAKRIPVQLPAQLVRCRGLLGVFLSPPGLKNSPTVCAPWTARRACRGSSLQAVFPAPCAELACIRSEPTPSTTEIRTLRIFFRS